MIVECNADQALVTALGIAPNSVEHSSGKGSVCRKLERGAGLRAIVDEDPNSPQPTYLDVLQAEPEQSGIRVLTDGARNNKLILICPRLEEWLISAAKEANLRMEDFGLPGRSRELHESLGANPRPLERLLGQLQGKSARIDRLISLLR